MSMVPPAVLSNFFEKQWTQNHPQYLSGLSCALYPTTFLEIAVYKRCKSVLQLDCFTSHLSSIFLSSAKIPPPLRKSFSKRTVWISKHFSQRFDVALTSFWSDKINLNLIIRIFLRTYHNWPVIGFLRSKFFHSLAESHQSKVHEIVSVNICFCHFFGRFFTLH